MSINRKPDAGGPARTAPGQAVSDRAKHIVAVPRRWLIALLALVIAPWIVVAGLYTFYESASPPESVEAAPAPQSNGPSRSAANGPWGDLSLSPIIVSPPLEYVSDDWGGRPNAPDRWWFPGVTSDLIEAFLISIGMAPADVARVRAGLRPAPDMNGMFIEPDAELVRGLNSDVRARLYLQLAKSRSNYDQAFSFRFIGASPDAWFGGAPISPETRKLAEPFVYSDGDVMHFSDVEVIKALVPDVEEQRRLAKVLLRQATVLVRLHVHDSGEVERLADYWGRGGRRTDLRPLLESVVGGGTDHFIDIVHLLPAFGRNHLYRYPRVTPSDLDKPLLANCLWSSLNFFSDEPDDRFLDVDFALASLRKDYYIVESGFQLGDVVGFVDEAGNLYHAAVYLADGLLFTKNGYSTTAPWIIASVDQIKAYYRPRCAQPKLIYHRWNRF